MVMSFSPMNHILNRRAFLKSCGLGIAGTGMLGSLASAVEPLNRAGAPRLLLSLAAYSFRDFFTTNERARGAEGKRIDLLRFIDYCAEHGCQGAEPTSYYFPKDVDAEYLLKLRRHAFVRGVEISGMAVGNNFALPAGRETRWANHLGQEVGGPRDTWARRTSGFLRGQPKDISKAEAKKLCISAIEECAEYARRERSFSWTGKPRRHRGRTGGFSGHRSGHPRAPGWASIWTQGNFHSDDPYRDLALCAPYAVNVQVKSEMRRARTKKSEPADLPRLIKMLRDVNYQGYVALEYEAAEDPWKCGARVIEAVERTLRLTWS